jgi:hypothetical protein
VGHCVDSIKHDAEVSYWINRLRSPEQSTPGRLAFQVDGDAANETEDTRRARLALSSDCGILGCELRNLYCGEYDEDEITSASKGWTAGLSSVEKASGASDTEILVW